MEAVLPSNPLFIIGTRCSGKASVVNAILGVNLLPTGCSLRTHSTVVMFDGSVAEDSVVVTHRGSSETYQLDEAKKSMRLLQLSSDDVLLVKVNSPHLMDNTIVLPGSDVLFTNRELLSTPGRYLFVYDGEWDREASFALSRYIPWLSRDWSSVFFLRNKVDYDVLHFDTNGIATREYDNTVTNESRDGLNASLSLRDIPQVEHDHFLASSAIDAYIASEVESPSKRERITAMTSFIRSV